MRFFLVLSIIGAMGCTRAGTMPRDAAAATDMNTVDAGVDAGVMSCTSDPQCNLGLRCMVDQCIAGNVCMHTDTCPSGQHCTATGCVSGMTTCTTNTQCDDNVYCNGVETCQNHQCIPGTAVNCASGDPCNIGSCDEATRHCRYMTVCDSGIVTTDAGPVCTPFRAPTDFNGSYLLAPSQNQGCGVTMYTISTITITTSGTGTSISGLLVDNVPVTLSGPAPSGSSFTATYTDRCGTYTLTGMFGSCRESFAGHWTATFTCGCVPMNATITGLRSS